MKPLRLRPTDGDVLYDQREDVVHRADCPRAPDDAVRWAEGVGYAVAPMPTRAACCYPDLITMLPAA